ncbi:hypothetical protein SAMN04515656_11211 [Eubacterium aggregans]|uniref:Phage gp6-like head-tail connector protein n=1 Tax=Eubacterium aggregans TaxID=81409 RepID=A0A1H4BNG8_9FIRM|nr:hypothetical protein [Eubacterium aggregans]SEA49598.1 hypothetical protein SAMN04515656_11211 [Eubacterium aggregans]
MIRERIRNNLRISHHELDDEIESTIKVARAELIRSGVSASAANGDDPLIEEAIVAYAMFKMAPDENDRYQESFLYQQDCLRKSSGYKRVVGDDE